MSDDDPVFETKADALKDAMFHAAQSSGAQVFICIGKPNCAHDPATGPPEKCDLCQRVDPHDTRQIDEIISALDRKQ